LRKELVLQLQQPTTTMKRSRLIRICLRMLRELMMILTLIEKRRKKNIDWV
jgi:hypothetical protein